ncbi:MAG: YhbY family RNA-binding protein [Ruminococcus sp.]|uniref:YhbY family RNA-binding protein n=1 Tax=Ruminococcus sp. TaxID=41978 RepID=UPI00399549C1
MLTSKQRSTLRGIASKYETILQVGKGGISEALVQQVKDALRKRELIKMRVLDNCPLDAREAAEELAARTGSEVVQVIGSRFVLFLRNSKEPVVQF